MISCYARLSYNSILTSPSFYYLILHTFDIRDTLFDMSVENQPAIRYVTCTAVIAILSSLNTA